MAILCGAAKNSLRGTMGLYKGDAGGLPSQQGIQLRRDNIFMIEVTIHQNADHNNPCEQ